VARGIDQILTPETGRILKQAREARGISMSDVAGRLRLHQHYIECMESGDVRSLPPDPYRKAFIKEYARFLGIKLEALEHPDLTEPKNENIISSSVSAVPSVAKKMTREAASLAQEVKQGAESVVKKAGEGVKDAVEEITSRDLWEEADRVRQERLGLTKRKEEEQTISVRKKENPISSPLSPRREVSPPLPPVIGEEPLSIPNESRRARRLGLEEDVLEENYSPVVPVNEEDDVRGGMSRATKTIVALLIAIAEVVGYYILTKKQNQPTVIIPEQKTATKQPERKTKPQPVLPVTKDSLTQLQLTSGDSLIFTIAAKDTVWVSISPDIGNGFRGKLAKGEMRRFSAREKYFIFLGNQKSVSMTLDGKPLTNLPTVPGSNIVVRNAILTKDQVSIAENTQGNKSQRQSLQNNTITQQNSKSKKKKKSEKVPPIKDEIRTVKPQLPR
jgi:transcriptional regulator with XRE-family HTH domain